jgi:hypothetical protein
MRTYLSAEEFDLMTEDEIDAWEKEKELVDIVLSGSTDYLLKKEI